jgi:hypothetical protein
LFQEVYTKSAVCCIEDKGGKLGFTQAYKHLHAHWNLYCYCRNNGYTSGQWTKERDNDILSGHLRVGKSRLLIVNKDTIEKIVNGERSYTVCIFVKW